jgi:transposase
MIKRVTDDLHLDYRTPWPLREARLIEHAGYLRTDLENAWAREDAAVERAKAAEARIRTLQKRQRTLEAELSRARRRIGELEALHRIDAAANACPQLPRRPCAFTKPNVAAAAKKVRRKPPGRKPGHPAALRPMPATIHQVIDVPLPRNERGRELCPCCNTPLTDLRDHQRIVEDVKPPEPQVSKFTTRSGHCVTCDRRVESRAAHQPPAPPGVDLPQGQVGINALAMGVMLRIRHRLPFRQITTIFERLASLKLSPGALVKQMKRIARWLSGEYQKLVLRMRASKVLHADETGWRIDGHNAWTWVFTQPLLTLFVIDKSRGRKVINDILGQAFDGTVVCDFYSAYDGLPNTQRCLTHLLRELKELGETDPSFARQPWVMKLKTWCRRAIAHKKKWQTLTDAAYEMGASRLEDRLDALIRAGPTEHDDDEQAKRLHKRLAKHRPDLTRFLWNHEVEPTNNPAERALRPMVVARKITGGSRSPAAADAWAKLSSVLATQEQNGKNVLTETKKLLIDYWGSEGR